MLSHQYVYAYAAVSPQDGLLDSLVLPEVNGQWMNEFLVEIASRYPHENIVMVVDGAGWHKSKRFAMLANLKLLFLPPYSPELKVLETQHDTMKGIAAWDWIISAISNGN